ncbi:MAG: M20 family metallopeptidase [Chloroflexota bacterium]|nr:M20 family metallopeptidase [Chloroflexota bacterium]
MLEPERAVVQLTQAMVRIPSENPTGNEVALSRFIREWLEAHKIEVQLQAVEGERVNVIGRVRGQGGPPLVLIAHMDTVPIGEQAKWKHDPFGGEIEDGSLYGRGSCDMKGGMAAALVVLAKLQRAVQEEGLNLSGDLVLACTVDEEESLMKGSSALGHAKIFGPDAYLLTMEPTGCKLNVAHKGAFWYEVTFLGKLAHAANPQIGVDANRAMAEAITGWYQRAEELASKMAPHPLLGLPTLVVSRVQGGIKTNVVSEYCRAEIDMRVPPPLTATEVASLLQGVVEQVEAKWQGITSEIRPMTTLRPPVECDPHSPLVAAFDRGYKSVLGQEAEHLGFQAYTDAAMLAVMTGNPNAVVFGPGLLSDAHTTDEKVEISQLITAVRVLEATARELLGK